MNMIQFLGDTVKAAPNNLFLAREKVTYKEFYDLVKKRATTLSKLGVNPGDSVGILAHNIPEWPLTAFAIWYLGARAVLIDTNSTPFELDGNMPLVGVKLVVAEKEYIYKAKGFKFHDIEAKDGAADKKLMPSNADYDDIATFSFTSGSTGNPKIVPLSHFNLIECAKSLDDMSKWFDKGDVMYGFLPICHVFGFSTEILACLRYNASVVLQPKIDPALILADFKEFRPHIIPGVPRVWELFRNKIVSGMKEKGVYGKAMFILKHQKLLRALGLGFIVAKVQNQVKDVFGGRVRLLIAGGGKTKPEVEKFYENLGLTYIQGYGLTETVGPICISKPGKKRKAFAMGSTITNNEFELRDKNELGIGTIWLRGNNVFKGYYNNPVANKEVLDKKGWFDTGDLGSIDENGELHFEGRKKLVIVLESGKNIYPDELEAQYIEIPGVKNVAVFEHERRGKTIAYAVFSVDPGVAIQQIADGMKEKNKKIASYKWVQHFAITEGDLPETSTKKIKHHVVRENLISGKYPNQND